MSKRTISNSPDGKTMGRSMGKPVKDPVVGDTVSAKIYKARRKNNPRKYKEVDDK